MHELGPLYKNATHRPALFQQTSTASASMFMEFATYRLVFGNPVVV